MATTKTKEIKHLSVKISLELYTKIKKKSDRVKRSPHYLMVECLGKGFK